MKQHARSSEVAEVAESEVVLLLGHRVNMDRRTFENFVTTFADYYWDAVDRDSEWACMYLEDV